MQARTFCYLLEPRTDKSKVQLMEVLILEHVQKPYAIEENFNSLFKHHTVQEEWIFRTKNYLEKLEKAER